MRGGKHGEAVGVGVLLAYSTCVCAEGIPKQLMGLLSEAEQRVRERNTSCACLPRGTCVPYGITTWRPPYMRETSSCEHTVFGFLTRGVAAPRRAAHCTAFN
eukprot:276045-Prymnesium_polylepis.1